jgi:peptidoglycan/xylan/chitin deacetylase (PgdA/CDA1 family)
MPPVPARARRLLKTAAAQALSWSRGDRLIARLGDAHGAPLILGYHRVVADFEDGAREAIPAMLTSRAMFEAQLDWIGRRYRFVSLEELGAGPARGGRRLAAVTFDDGYRDVYEEALPILLRKGIPAAVFVVTDLVGSRALQVHDRLYLLLRRAFAGWPEPGRALRALLAELAIPGVCPEGSADWSGPHRALVHLLRSLSRHDVERIAAALEARAGADVSADGMLPLTWEMVERMARAGITVGSHTRSHRWLTREPSETVLAEARESREAIERRLGVPVRHFAYPDGRFDGATARTIAAAGYRFGYTTCTHRDAALPELTRSRLMLWERACVDWLERFSPAIMSCQVHGVFDLMGACDQKHAA